MIFFARKERNVLYCYCFYGYCSHTMNSYFSTFLCTGVLYTMMIKKKRITAALLALGLGAVTMFSQFPVSAAEETAQNTDAAAQTADPSVVVTNGIDGWPQASDISSAAAIVMETSTNTVLYSKKCRSAPLPCKRSQDHDLPGCS